MDIDTVDENETPAESQKAAGKKPLSLPVDDAHPLDLDAITSSYTGPSIMSLLEVLDVGLTVSSDRSIVERLVHITAACPAVAVQALQLALDQVFKMRDTNLYFSVRSAYEQCQGNSQGQLPPITEIAPLDQKWIDETAAKNAAEKNKLEVELKTYSSNMIKESIRVRARSSTSSTTFLRSAQMAHRDLANYYRAVGDQASALKHYTKSREFCTTSHHVLDMCFSIIEVCFAFCTPHQVAQTYDIGSCSLSTGTTLTCQHMSSKLMRRSMPQQAPRVPRGPQRPQIHRLIACSPSAKRFRASWMPVSGCHTLDKVNTRRPLTSLSKLGPSSPWAPGLVRSVLITVSYSRPLPSTFTTFRNGEL